MVVTSIRRPRRVTLYRYLPGQDAYARIIERLPADAVVYIGDDELLASWRDNPLTRQLAPHVRHTCQMRAAATVFLLVEPTVAEVDDAMRLCSGHLMLACLQDSKANEAIRNLHADATVVEL